jgi:ApbE superfamily uncharacterized protein (UPF0280 family)
MQPEWENGGRWQRFHIEIEESILTVLCDAVYQEVGFRAVREARIQIQDYITEHTDYASSFEPLQPSKGAPDIVNKMCRAANMVGVGPMAAVAGTIAESTLHAILAAGAEEAVVDNGGDIVLQTVDPIRVGLFAGAKGIDHLAFEIGPQNEILAICTSSGTIGHSFSYGRADAAVVLSRDAAVADAAATALGNQIKNDRDLESAFDIFNDNNALMGALAILGDKIALWGELPKIVRANVNEELITQGIGHGKG